VGLTKTVGQVKQGEHGVGEKQAPPAVEHHRANLLAPVGRVTVDRTFAAGGLVLLEGAMAQPFQGIGEQLATRIALFGHAAVVVPAISADHEFHGSGFAPHPP